MSATMKNLFALTFAVVGTALTGCTAEVADDLGEDGQSVDEVTGANANFGYFVVTGRDYKKCLGPRCGGYYVKRVNQQTTTCADGQEAAECYVASITFNGIGLSEREQATLQTAVDEGRVVLKARTYKHREDREIGVLKANEAWIGATGSAADGTFFRVADNGLRCITAPCPSTTAYQLNTSNTSYQVLHTVLDQTTIPATQEALDDGYSALATEDGVIVAGGIAMPRCMAEATDCGNMVHASEFFLRFTHTEGKACGARLGDTCGADQYCAWAPEGICGWADATGVCTYRSGMMCPQVYQPVCGCDNQTYGNACMAGSAGVSIQHDGECAEAPGTAAE